MPTFDELKDLAQHDPECFEQLRVKLIEDSICHSPKRLQRRLRGLQFTIEARRRVASNPIKVLLDIQGMMYDSLLGLQQVLCRKKDPSESAVRTKTCALSFRRSPSPKN